MSLFPFSKPPPGAQIDWTHPLSRGLVGCWLFNEGAGIRANDLSPYGNHGTLTNFEPYSATSGWTGGKFGTALRFDGVNDYVDLPAIDLRSGDWTISIWEKRDITSNLYSIGLGRSDTWSNFIGTGTNYGRYFFFSRDKNGVNINIDSGVNVDTLNYVHQTITYDGTTIYQYINGNFKNSTIIDIFTSFNSFNTTTIGALNRISISFFLKGFINEVRIYNRMLSSQEVQYLYSNPFCMIRARPIGVRHV